MLTARLPAKRGWLLLKALEGARSDLPLPPEDCEPNFDVPAGTSGTFQRSHAPKIPPTAQRADALALVAESFLKHGAEALSGGERHQIVIHVDEETLRERAQGRSEFEHGPSMPVETVRRLSCDCSYVKITEDEKGEPLDVGRKTRSIPPALRRALNSRDKGCVFPGCTHKRYVDGHHVHHWAEGGETKLGNLVSLCRFHHRQVHEGGIRIERLDDGAWRFVNAKGDRGSRRHQDARSRWPRSGPISQQGTRRTASTSTRTPPARVGAGSRWTMGSRSTCCSARSVEHVPLGLLRTR